MWDHLVEIFEHVEKFHTRVSNDSLGPNLAIPYSFTVLILYMQVSTQLHIVFIHAYLCLIFLYSFTYIPTKYLIYCSIYNFRFSIAQDFRVFLITPQTHINPKIYENFISILLSIFHSTIPNICQNFANILSLSVIWLLI